jgi:hypothetical protein
MKTVNFTVLHLEGPLKGSTSEQYIRFPNADIARSWITTLQLRIQPANFFSNEKIYGNFRIL